MLDKEYWNNHWKENNTGWDIGYASPPLMEYLDSLENKSLRILIPGSGSGYEAGEAYLRGFEQVYYNDISPEAARRFKRQFPEFPGEQILNTDFYSIEDEFDLILEQTSFCAQPPSRRKEYIDKVHELLSPEGIYAGVLFDIHFPFGGPPFGGDKEEYRQLLAPVFEIIKMEKCYNSIISRQGKELFVLLTPK